jgi:hypothetical protein
MSKPLHGASRKRREAERRKAHTNGPRHTLGRYRPNMLRARTRATNDPLARTVRLRARSPYGAPLRLWSSDRMLGPGPGRASRDEVRRRYLRLWTALKPSTWLAGRHAGGHSSLHWRKLRTLVCDARTARERLARPPAGTALAPPSGSHPESTLRGASGGASTRRKRVVKDFIPGSECFDPAIFF